MTTRTEAAALHHLKDSDLTLADPRADIRGRKVIDSAGEEIGKVEDLLIDDQERKVRFVEVGSGGFLGLGETRFLLPVEAITGFRGDDVVQINQSRARMAEAPRYNPQLIERTYLSDLYGYYGYRTPFWDVAYAYPRYPYF